MLSSAVYTPAAPASSGSSVAPCSGGQPKTDSLLCGDCLCKRTSCTWFGQRKVPSCGHRHDRHWQGILRLTREASLTVPLAYAYRVCPLEKERITCKADIIWSGPTSVIPLVTTWDKHGGSVLSGHIAPSNQTANLANLPEGPRYEGILNMADPMDDIISV